MQSSQSKEPGSKSEVVGRFRHLGRELFIVSLLVFGASISNLVSQQDTIHFALTWSLVSSHSIWLNPSMYLGQPYVEGINGRALSALPPGLAYFGFAFAWLALLMLPMDPSVAGVFLSIYLSCIVGGLASLVFFKVGRSFGSEKSSAIVTLVFAFGTSMWIYSRLYLPEGLATLLGIASVYFALRTIRRDASHGEEGVFGFLSGTLLGLMVFVDNMGIFFVLPVLVYVSFASSRRDERTIRKITPSILFILGLVLGLTPTAYYDLATTGNAFIAPYGLPFLGGVSVSSYGFGLRGLFDLILSPQSGLLFFTPFVLVSLVGFFYLLFLERSGGRTRLEDTILFIALFLSILIPFSLQNQGTFLHNTIGPSELVLAIPYILFPAVLALDKFRAHRYPSLASYALAAGSILINGIIAITEPVLSTTLAINNLQGPTSSPFLTINIPLLLSGSFLTWWSFFEQPFFYAIALLVFPILILGIYAARIEARVAKKNIGLVKVLSEMSVSTPRGSLLFLKKVLGRKKSAVHPS